MTHPTIKARPYTGAEDLVRIQRMIAHSASVLGDCNHMHVGDFPHRLYNGQRDHNPADIVRVWEAENGEIVGWVLTQPRFTGFDFMVTPEYRNTALEDEVIEWGIANTREWLTKLGIDEPVGTDFFTSDEVDNEARRLMLLKHGFEPNEPVMIYTTRPIAEPIPPLELPAGFSVRSAEGEHEAGKLAEVHHGAFDSGWSADQYLKVMRSPGYDTERELVIVAPDGRFAAFCIIWLDDLNKVGLFEPVGAHADFRRMGLTRQLMYEGLRRMQAAGMETAIVLYEVDNPASTRLYESVGFKPKYQICDYTIPEDMS